MYEILPQIPKTRHEPHSVMKQWHLMGIVKEKICYICLLRKSRYMIKSRICEMLGIEYPVFQGGMAWIADASLAAAVSDAGGL